MPTSRQDKEFKETLQAEIGELPNSILDTSIEWIAKNLDPEDVFSVSDLERWAEANGYVKGGDNE